MNTTEFDILEDKIAEVLTRLQELRSQNDELQERLRKTRAYAIAQKKEIESLKTQLAENNPREEYQERDQLLREKVVSLMNQLDELQQ
ncbi:hypothetical protein K8I28_03615 [bacterium]|nr:hypothetical protein [bacterium]